MKKKDQQLLIETLVEGIRQWKFVAKSADREYAWARKEMRREAKAHDVTQDQLQTANLEIGEREKRIVHLQKELDAKYAELDRAKAESKETEGTMADLLHERKELREKVEELTMELAKVRDEFRTYRSQNAPHLVNVTGMDATIKRLEDELAGKDAAMKTAQSSYASLVSQVADLQRRSQESNLPLEASELRALIATIAIPMSVL